MLFNVPQFVDVEDKIVGPLTWKQLLWMIGMSVILLLLWNTVSKAVFFMAGIPITLIFLALAFYRPYNQPLIAFIMQAILFLFRPKVYTWRREAEKKYVPQKREIPIVLKKENSLAREDVEALARTLDSEGVERNEKIFETIKNRKN